MTGFKLGFGLKVGQRVLKAPGGSMFTSKSEDVMKSVISSSAASSDLVTPVYSTSPQLCLWNVSNDISHPGSF